MRKFTLILIALTCFATGIITNRGVITYQREKAKQRFISDFKNSLPNLTPTDVFKNYWVFSSQNRLDELELLATEIPNSYWVRCNNDISVHDFKEEVEGYYQEFAGVLYQLRHHITMMRANRPRLGELTVLKETVFNDEATVDFKYLGDESRAFFKKEAGIWKIFVINPMSLDFLRVDEYAHPRPFCKQLEENKNIADYPQIELKKTESNDNFESWKP